MHTITTTKPLELGPSVGIIDPGEYLIDDINAGRLLMHYRDSVSLTKAHMDSNESDMYLFAGGLAFGDQLLFMPVVERLIETGKSVAVSLFKQYQGVFSEFQNLENPLNVRMIDTYVKVISIENAFENKERHITDVFAEIAGVALTKKSHRYIVTETESQYASEKYPSGDKKRIGVQVNASTPVRTYPHMNLLVDLLLKDGWQIMLFGSPGEIKTPDKNDDVINLSADGLSFRQSVAVLNTCDAFIGPDSALIHYAGSLQKPSIGLYGPFSWKTRTSYWDSVFSIQGSKECDLAPCHHHSWTTVFPKAGPCSKKGYCLPLASIEPDRIVSKLKQIA